jgi:hypothetical protein
MNTARVVVPTIAVDAIGATACPSAAPAARLLDGARRNSGLLSPALNRITAPNVIQSGARGDRAFQRDDSITSRRRNDREDGHEVRG